MQTNRIAMMVAALLLVVGSAGADEFWGGVTATAVCEGVPAVRGVVRVDGGTFPWVQECPDQCWFAQSMLDANFPAELADLEGLVVDVFGEVRLGMEGCYVVHTGWELVSSVCGPVPVSETTWSAVKGRFR